jgi:hypothetical protein
VRATERAGGEDRFDRTDVAAVADAVEVSLR